MRTTHLTDFWAFLKTLIPRRIMWQGLATHEQPLAEPTGTPSPSGAQTHGVRREETAAPNERPYHKVHDHRRF
jgi:hypothetical protein